MKNSSTVLALIGVVACGSPQNSNVMSESLAGGGGFDKKLGLSSAAGDKYGSSVTGLRTNIDIAFGSFVNYRNASNKRCSGFLAKDLVQDIVGYSNYGITPIYGNPYWKVYFYTARHCFEVWTPIGIRSEFTVNISEPKSYTNPWLAANVFNPTIVAKNPERFSYSDGRKTDVIRISQPNLNPDKYLPVCSSKDSWSSSVLDSHQAIGYTNVRQTANPGLVWANMSTLVPSEMPLNMKNVMKTATNEGAYKWANGIKASPGDSGAPIWGIKRAADGVGVDRYTCVSGVVTRELWVESGCDRAVCRMRGESVFEILKGFASGAGAWVTF